MIQKNTYSMISIHANNKIVAQYASKYSFEYTGDYCLILYYNVVKRWVNVLHIKQTKDF